MGTLACVLHVDFCLSCLLCRMYCFIFLVGKRAPALLIRLIDRCGEKGGKDV